MRKVMVGGFSHVARDRSKYYGSCCQHANILTKTYNVTLCVCLCAKCSERVNFSNQGKEKNKCYGCGLQNKGVKKVVRGVLSRALTLMIELLVSGDSVECDYKFHMCVTVFCEV